MARGTMFGSIHSSLDLNLIQQSVEISPAQPKTNYVEIPGGDGSLDLTEALGEGARFYDREIKWTFALYPGADWYAKQAEVSNALNGLACHITPDGDEDYYYDGRLTVYAYKSDHRLRQITVKAVCRPFKRKKTETSVTSTLTTSNKSITLTNGRMPVVPTIKVTAKTVITFGSYSATVEAGTYTLPQIRLKSGSNTLKAKTSSGTGSITITYREGSL